MAETVEYLGGGERGEGGGEKRKFRATTFSPPLPRKSTQGKGGGWEEVEITFSACEEGKKKEGKAKAPPIFFKEPITTQEPQFWPMFQRGGGGGGEPRCCLCPGGGKPGKKGGGGT